jgi:Gluconate 2-dehydrogenase subunit 3
MKETVRVSSEEMSSGLVARVQPGYYPRFSTLEQQDYWDEATRNEITKRITSSLPVRFFAFDEAKLLRAVIDRLLPQDDRIPEKRIPILSVIDERLYKNALIGFRYEDMPPDREAYRLGLRAINQMAEERFEMPFLKLSTYPQELILKSIHDGAPDPAVEIWNRMPVRRFWTLLFEDCVNAYYAHPWAWDEIGFGGPAYPRGYMRLENGLPEPWETEELRYVLSAPADTLSDLDLAAQTKPHATPLFEGTR